MASKTLTWHSPDGHWKVEGLSVDTDGHGPQPKFRVWHDDIAFDGDLLVHQTPDPDWHPNSGNSRCRTGPHYGPGGWILAADVWPASEVEDYVSWDDLAEIPATTELEEAA